MARSRNIKPGFFESEQLGRCPLGSRLLFAALWTLADREGKLEDRPMKIRSYAFPYDPITVQEVTGWMDSLERENLIERYESGGQNLILIPAFLKHQNPHQNEKKSVLPDNFGTCTEVAPDNSSTCTEVAPEFLPTIPKKAPERHQSFSDSSSEKIGLIPDSGFLIPDSLIPALRRAAVFDVEKSFDELWAAYPAKGRTKRPMSQQYYTQAIATLPDDRQAEMHRRILAPVLPGGKWEQSAQWAKGFVQSLAMYLSQQQWLEDPPEADGDGGMLTTKFVPKPRPSDDGAYEPIPVDWPEVKA